MKNALSAAVLAAFAVIAAPMAASGQTALIRAQAGAVAAAPTQLTGAARTDALTKASAALNRIANVQGRFSQIAPDGTRSAGQFWLSRGQGARMGKLRFEYDAPSQFLVVANGVNVATIDRQLRSTTTVGIGETPLQYLLKSNINLDRDARVVQVAQGGGSVLITVRDRSNQVDGSLTLALDPNTFALKAWDVTDGARNTTRLSLTEQRAVGAISPRLFVIETFGPANRRPR